MPDEAEIEEVRLDLGRRGFVVVGAVKGRVTARLRREEAVRHGRVWPGERWRQGRFSIKTADGRSLQRGHGLWQQ